MFPTARRSTARPQPTRAPAPRRPAPSKCYGSDYISLIGFHDQGFVLQCAARLQEARLQRSILALHERVAGTSTNLSDGLRQGIAVLSRSHPGLLRRLWLLTDGYPNRETERIYELVDAACAAHININTIGFGDRYDEALLRRISQATHNGRFVSVQNLRALTDALGVGQRPPRRHRAEHTAYAIDLSGSMVLGQMQGRTKIAVVQDALVQLLHYKRQCFG
jgi:Mg-chelatase subunit ChlD